MAAEHDLLLVRPHPHSPHDIAGLDALLRVPQMRLTTANTYRLLATPNVKTLIAISSSLLTEGTYLGTATIALADEWNAIDSHTHFALETLTGPVAEAIAETCGGDIAVRGPPPAHAAGALRTMIGIDWSAADVGRASQAVPAIDLEAASSTVLAGSAPELAPALVFGWHAQEPWGVWGSGPISTLSFRWPAYVNSAMFVIEVVAFDYVGGFGTRVEIWAEGRLIETFVAPPPDTSVKVAFLVERTTILPFLQIHMRCDAQRDISNTSVDQDTRRLGVGLVSIAWIERDVTHYRR